MFNKDKKKLNGYPSPLASNEDKATNEYGLEYFRAMYYEWHNNADVYFRDIKMRYVKNRAYAEGNQDVGKYKDLLDVEGDSSYLNIDWSPVSIIPKFVDVIVNGMVNQDYDVKAKSIDPVATDKRYEQKKKMYADMMMSSLIAKVEDKTGMKMTNESFVADSPEEIEMYMAMNCRDSFRKSYRVYYGCKRL